MVNWRGTWLGIHWLGWVSFFTLIIGVAAMMTAIALPNFWSNDGIFYDKNTGTRETVYIGLWSLCGKVTVKIDGLSQTPSGSACFTIDSSCNAWEGLLNVVNNCSKFHALIAVLLLACMTGGLAVFVNWAALAIMIAHGSISTFMVKTGGFVLSVASGVLGLVAMILAVQTNDDVLGSYGGIGAIKYGASFGVLIVGWIFVIFSAVTFAISARRCGGGFNSEGTSGEQGYSGGNGNKGNFSDENI